MRQFVKFGIVGASGLVINGVIAHVLQKTTTLAPFTDFAIGFMTGGVSNYALNRVWTFRSDKNAFVEGAQFLAVSAVSLVFGKVIFSVADRVGFHHFTATWFLATLAGVLVNFFVNKYWTFRHVA